MPDWIVSRIQAVQPLLTDRGSLYKVHYLTPRVHSYLFTIWDRSRSAFRTFLLDSVDVMGSGPSRNFWNQLASDSKSLGSESKLARSNPVLHLSSLVHAWLLLDPTNTVWPQPTTWNGESSSSSSSSSSSISKEAPFETIQSYLTLQDADQEGDGTLLVLDQGHKLHASFFGLNGVPSKWCRGDPSQNFHFFGRRVCSLTKGRQGAPIEEWSTCAWRPNNF